jgi:cytosine deaminase
VTGPSLTIANATVPAAIAGEPGSGATRRVDITVSEGRIASIVPGGTAPAAGSRVDADGGLVLPCFVDMHTHLDKGHIWPRRSNPDGTWIGALLSVQSDRESNWAAADVERRMTFALRCAYAHGTAAIRTHLDSAPPQHEITWDVFSKVRDAWAGRIELQACSIIGPDTALNAAELDAVAKTVAQHRGILGGSIAVHPDSKRAILNTLDKAGDLGLPVDLHIDETTDPASSALLHLADAVIETGFDKPVSAGHCCAISVQDRAVAQRTIERVAEAGISVVSLPMCNMYLMHRDPAGAVTPLRRGPTMVKELDAAGVTIAMASDNTRDPFYAYGDHDMLEVFREGARILHFDHPQDNAWRWLSAVTTAPRRMMGTTFAAELAVGQPADFVLFSARTWTELLARPQSDRRVFRSGAAIDTTLPDYRELDDLMEAS